MITFILFISIYSNNAFYGVDYTPNMQFKTAEQCESVLKVIKSKQPNTKSFCQGVKL